MEVYLNMKIIIATGGSGGHLFPALRVAQVLKGKGHDIFFLGSFRLGKEKIKESGFVFEDIGAIGLTKGISQKTFYSIICMSRAFFRALWVVRRFHPGVVIGFGGYGAFPVVLSAVLLRRPTLIHEQNVIPGRTNALLSKGVKRIAISFQKSVKYFSAKKTFLTGCPCHFPEGKMDREAIFNAFHLDPDKKTFFVFGGSQGSQRINEIFLETAQYLKKSINFQVIHVSGGQNHGEIENQYNQLGIPFALFEFLDKMEDAYQVSDLVISRSGAGTVHEIAIFGVPAIFIPYPHAGGHQRANASVLCDLNLAWLIEEKDLSAQKLGDMILEVCEGYLNMENTSKGYEDVYIAGADEKIAQEALEIGLCG